MEAKVVVVPPVANSACEVVPLGVLIQECWLMAEFGDVYGDVEGSSLLGAVRMFVDPAEMRLEADRLEERRYVVGGVVFVEVCRDLDGGISVSVSE